ncbi:MAG: hypothetical protein AAF633_24250, partial [Chloroflexota bacterium]
VANQEIERFLAINRPAGIETAAAGYNFFFDGVAEQPVNFVVNIGILDSDCQTILSRESFTLRGSGYWQGFVVVPQNASGPGCAIAWFGEEGSAERREAVYEIDILAAEDNAASGLLIANPPPNETVRPGERILFYGTTYSPEGDGVQLTVRQSDGAVIATESISSNRFGYWEEEVLLPVEISGSIEVTVDNGSGFDVIVLEVETD